MTSEAQLKKKRLMKLNPRAHIGYLVGYDSTNIYRIWIPHKGIVISTRDVIFDEETFFKGKRTDLQDELIAELDTLIEKIKLPEAQTKNEVLLQEDDEVPEPDHEGEESEVEEEPIQDFNRTEDLELAKVLEEAYQTPPETDNKDNESPYALYVLDSLCSERGYCYNNSHDRKLGWPGLEFTVFITINLEGCLSQVAGVRPAIYPTYRIAMPPCIASVLPP